MNKAIQVFKPLYRIDEVLDEIRECLERGWTGIGFKTIEFEEAWKKYAGFEHCHFLNSATAGLHLAVKIFKDKLGWREGDEVISTALTFVSTNHAILYERLTPVFADVDESLCLDPSSVERMLTERTRAVMYVGMGGNVANYREIVELCKRRKLVLILDAAHLSGTKWLDTKQQVGSDSDCAVFSYQAVKNCPIADAGAICFADADLDHAARSLGWLGIDKSTFSRYSEQSYKWRYDVTELGFKYHGNSIMAAMGLVSLKYLDQDNERRRQLAQRYLDALSGDDRIQCIPHTDEALSSRHLFQVAVDRRDTVVDALARDGIFCGVHYIENSAYHMYSAAAADLVNTRSYSDRLITLPMHLHLQDFDADFICERVKRAVSDA